jgi:hypothetical protein
MVGGLMSEYTHTVVHEAGHVVAVDMYAPGAHPDVEIYGARRGRTEYDTQEDPEVRAKIAMAGIVATKLILQQPRVITQEFMIELGAGEDLGVVQEFLADTYLTFEEFASEVEIEVITQLERVEAVVAAIRKHKGKLTIEQVEAVLG